MFFTLQKNTKRKPAMITITEYKPIRCPECGAWLTPQMFVEKEYDKNNVPTGRTRLACDFLLCENCGHKEITDDDFLVRPWHF